MSACFLSNLEIELVTDGVNKWRLTSPLHYFTEIIPLRIVVPEGFSTDLDSVVRVPIVYDLLANRYMRAAVIHDYMYSSGVFSRRVCDSVFREAIIATGGNSITATLMWLGVRLFGSLFYSYRKLRSLGRAMSNQLKA